MRKRKGRKKMSPDLTVDVRVVRFIADIRCNNDVLCARNTFYEKRAKSMENKRLVPMDSYIYERAFHTSRIFTGHHHRARITGIANI